MERGVSTLWGEPDWAQRWHESEGAQWHWHVPVPGWDHGDQSADREVVRPGEKDEWDDRNS